MFLARLKPVACSKNTFGYLFATFSVASMKPNEVVKISLWPVAASCSIARSASAPSGTFSRNVVSTLSPSAFSMRLAADVVLIAPAEVADRPDIDESDFQLLSGVGVAPNVATAIARTAAIAIDVPFPHDLHSGLERRAFFIPLIFAVPLRAKRPNAPAGRSQRSGTNTTPSDAGAADPAVPRVREINTRTTTVAR